MLSNIERYSSTDLKIDLKKLEVVFKAENVEVIFQNFIVLKQLLTFNRYSQANLKPKSKLTGLNPSEPNFTELVTAQPPLVFLLLSF